MQGNVKPSIHTYIHTYLLLNQLLTFQRSFHLIEREVKYDNQSPQLAIYWKNVVNSIFNSLFTIVSIRYVIEQIFRLVCIFSPQHLQSSVFSPVIATLLFRVVGRSENPGEQVVTGITCSPGWDRVNWSDKIGGYHGTLGTPRLRQPCSYYFFSHKSQLLYQISDIQKASYWT